MFSVGDHIIYGVEGVCRVDEVGRLKVAGLDKNRDYYRLTPYYRGGTIYTPVDGRAVMRPVISREALEDLLPRLPELEPLADMPTDSRTVGEYYRGILAEHNCERLLRLCKSLYQKQQALSVLRRGVSATELRNWKMAEELLFGEFGFVLGLKPAEVKKYLHQRLGQSDPYTAAKSRTLLSGFLWFPASDGRISHVFQL